MNQSIKYRIPFGISRPAWTCTSSCKCIDFTMLIGDIPWYPNLWGFLIPCYTPGHLVAPHGVARDEDPTKDSVPKDPKVNLGPYDIHNYSAKKIKWNLLSNKLASFEMRTQTFSVAVAICLGDPFSALWYGMRVPRPFLASGWALEPCVFCDQPGPAKLEFRANSAPVQSRKARPIHPV